MERLILSSRERTQRATSTEIDEFLAEGKNMKSLLEGKLAAAARGSKLSKNEGSCISIIWSTGQQDNETKMEISKR